MASPSEEMEDAITEEEIQGTIVPASPSSTTVDSKRNAFTELLRPKPRKSTTIPSKTPGGKPLVFAGRSGLGAYTHDPAAFSPSTVIFYNEFAVAVNDLYPKSSVHTLLLPRSERNILHPIEAFEDAAFLASTAAECMKLRSLVGNELRRRYGKYSAKEQTRERALNGEVDVPDGEGLPTGRDWEGEVIVGVHARPSMDHLHVHVLSVDRYSEKLKNRAHYNSFTTPFFIPLGEFPLDKDDPRRDSHGQGYLSRDLKCWRCGAEFGRSFVRLKEHLAVEFEAWKRE